MGKGPGYMGVHLCSALLVYTNDSEVHSQSFIVVLGIQALIHAFNIRFHLVNWCSLHCVRV